MSLKIPRGFGGTAAAGALDALQYEIVQEKAATLARIGRKLEAALASLAEFDARSADAGAAADARAERDELVAAAGEALWYFVIQREVVGLRDTEAILRHLQVPREVRLRMGLRPRRP